MGLIKNGVEEGRGRLPLPNVMVFAREAIKKGEDFRKKCFKVMDKGV